MHLIPAFASSAAVSGLHACRSDSGKQLRIRVAQAPVLLTTTRSNAQETGISDAEKEHATVQDSCGILRSKKVSVWDFHSRGYSPKHLLARAILYLSNSSIVMFLIVCLVLSAQPRLLSALMCSVLIAKVA
jgi:hypothetical protein